MSITVSPPLSARSFIATIHEQMVQIPGGGITLRDDRVKSTWTVDLQPFMLSRYLVTEALYYDVTQVASAAFSESKKPVETVSWRDAVIFCNTLSNIAGLNPCYKRSDEESEFTFNAESDGFRLPTEAEWEYACKAGTTAVRYGELDEIAWYKINSGGGTNDVGRKHPNDWGLYDMLGNVWEWCSDIYDATVYGSYRVLRGGGWNDEERGCLATNRRRSHPVSFAIDDLGFRIARNFNY